jgi:hypothetical protein
VVPAGKQNSLLFQGKDGDLFKTYLVSVLDITCAGQTTTDTDTDYMTNIADSVLETETAGISPVKTYEINTDNNLDLLQVSLSLSCISIHYSVHYMT